VSIAMKIKSSLNRMGRNSLNIANPAVCPVLRREVKSLVRQAETGLSVTVQAIYYILLLFMFFAVVYDIGNAGNVSVIATNAVRVAAQDAAKHIDEQAFIERQEVRLSSDALGRAQDVVNGLTGGNVTILQVKVTSLQTRDVIMILGHAHAALPVMGAVFGINDVIIPVEAYAEPAYGISLEGQ